MQKGFIKLRRSLKEWEYYSDRNATRLLVHLLISVNYEEKKWRGIKCPRGSMIFTWDSLAKESHMTEKECRGAMIKLEMCGEVGRERAGKYQLVTLVKWAKMQFIDFEGAGKGQQMGQEVGRERAGTKEEEEKKEKIYDISKFLTDWNLLRQQILKTPSHLNYVTTDQKNEFIQLSKSYVQEDFKNALKGLFKQERFPNGNTSMKSNPGHFLKFFSTYLTAYYDKNPKLYGNED